MSAHECMRPRARDLSDGSEVVRQVSDPHLPDAPRQSSSSPEPRLPGPSPIRCPNVSKFVTVDTRGFDRLERILVNTRSRAIPYATRNALNDMAFAARKQWRTEMERSFILRNRWTVGSIRVEKASGTDVGTMHSVVGSVSSYLGKQEFGGTSREDAIPRPRAAGQPASMPTHTRTVRARYRLSGKIGKGRRPKLGKKRLVYLDSPKAGLYEVWGHGKKGGRRIVWDMSHGAVHNRAIPTLEPTVELVAKRGRRYYLRNLMQELRRVGWM